MSGSKSFLHDGDCTPSIRCTATRMDDKLSICHTPKPGAEAVFEAPCAMRRVARATITITLYNFGTYSKELKIGVQCDVVTAGYTTQRWSPISILTPCMLPCVSPCLPRNTRAREVARVDLHRITKTQDTTGIGPQNVGTFLTLF